MTIAADWDVKYQFKQTNKLILVRWSSKQNTKFKVDKDQEMAQSERNPTQERNSHFNPKGTIYHVEN